MPAINRRQVGTKRRGPRKIRSAKKRHHSSAHSFLHRFSPSKSLYVYFINFRSLLKLTGGRRGPTTRSPSHTPESRRLLPSEPVIFLFKWSECAITACAAAPLLPHAAVGLPAGAEQGSGSGRALLRMLSNFVCQAPCLLLGGLSSNTCTVIRSCTSCSSWQALHNCIQLVRREGEKCWGRLRVRMH